MTLASLDPLSNISFLWGQPRTFLSSSCQVGLLLAVRLHNTSPIIKKTSYYNHLQAVLLSATTPGSLAKLYPDPLSSQTVLLKLVSNSPMLTPQVVQPFATLLHDPLTKYVHRPSNRFTIGVTFERVHGHGCLCMQPPCFLRTLQCSHHFCHGTLGTKTPLLSSSQLIWNHLNVCPKIKCN